MSLLYIEKRLSASVANFLLQFAALLVPRGARARSAGPSRRRLREGAGGSLGGELCPTGSRVHPSSAVLARPTVLDILRGQLERCGPEALTAAPPRSCPSLALATLLAFAAGLLVGGAFVFVILWATYAGRSAVESRRPPSGAVLP